MGRTLTARVRTTAAASGSSGAGRSTSSRVNGVDGVCEPCRARREADDRGGLLRGLPHSDGRGPRPAGAVLVLRRISRPAPPLAKMVRTLSSLEKGKRRNYVASASKEAASLAEYRLGPLVSRAYIRVAVVTLHLSPSSCNPVRCSGRYRGQVRGAGVVAIVKHSIAPRHTNARPACLYVDRLCGCDQIVEDGVAPVTVARAGRFTGPSLVVPDPRQLGLAVFSHRYRVPPLHQSRVPQGD